MATLTGQTIANTYLTLLRLQSATIGADASAKTINDAADTASALSISTTRVGIGETAPNNLLQITHNVTTVVNAANVRDDAIRGITIEMTGNTNNAGSMLKFSGYAGGNVAAIAGIQQDASSMGMAFYTESSSTVLEQMRILGSGDVGIGTATPQTQLEIVSSTTHAAGTHTTLSNAVACLRLTNSNDPGGEDDVRFTGIDFATHTNNVVARIVSQLNGHTTAAQTFGDLVFMTKADTESDINEVMRLMSTGRVGIGTDTPTVLLDIESVKASTPFVRIATSDADGSANHGALLFGNSTTANQTAIYSKSDGAANSSKLIISTTTGGGSLNEAFTINKDGEVGIGDTTPNNLLSVATATGTYSHFGGIADTDTHYTGITLGYMNSGDADSQKTGIVQEQIGDGNVRGHLHFLVDIENNGETVSLEDSKMKIGGLTGNVGIGDFSTTEPAETLSVQGQAVFSTISGGGAVAVQDAECVEINSDTDSKFALRVRHHDADNPNGIIIYYSGGAPDTTDTDLFIKAVDTGTTRFRVDGKGDVETVTGQDIIAISDERLKENIADYTGGLALVNALKPRTFTWKSGVDRGMTGTRYGFIAQEMQTISDIKDNMGLVRSGKIDEDDPNYDAIMALCTDGVVNKSMMNAQQAILISAIQELSAKVEALENNNQTGDSSNEQEQESAGSGDSGGNSESSGEDSGGAEADSSDSSGST